MLPDIPMSMMTVSKGLRLAEHAQKLVADLGIIVPQLELSLPTRLGLAVSFCFHVFLARYQGFSV